MTNTARALLTLSVALVVACDSAAQGSADSDATRVAETSTPDDDSQAPVLDPVLDTAAHTEPLPPDDAPAPSVQPKPDESAVSGAGTTPDGGNGANAPPETPVPGPGPAFDDVDGACAMTCGGYCHCCGGGGSAYDPEPPCPVAPPMAGTPCEVEGLYCDYSLSCAVRDWVAAQCCSGNWQSALPEVVDAVCTEPEPALDGGAEPVTDAGGKKDGGSPLAR